MRALGSPRFSLFLVPALLPALALACSAGGPGATGAPDLGTGEPNVLTRSNIQAPEDDGELPPEATEQPPAALECSDAGSLAAALAVAVAHELHRWDALSDFQLRSGKLALSAMGELHCQAGCSNVRALLSLQDAAAGTIQGHDPVAFRAQLASWYGAQQSALGALMEQRLVLDKGMFRLKNRLSGKYMQVDAGSLAENAAVKQRASASQPGAEEWRVVLDHTTHRLINVRSGKCLSLSQDSAAQNVTLVQQACSSSALQRFGFAKNYDYYALFSKTGQSLRVRNDSTLDDAPVVQASADISQTGQQWALEPAGAGTLSPDVVADGMYTVVAKQSGKSMAVDAFDQGEGSVVQQDTFSADDDRHQWYVSRVSADKYNFINHQTGKCLDLESTSAAGRLVQRRCSDASTQRFLLTAAGDGTHVIYSLPGNAVEISGDGTTDRAPLALGSDTGWSEKRRFVFTPVLAAEPHQLSFSHSTDDGACGEHQWYDIQQPGGQALRDPAEAFLQLMFAGGRQTASGDDENPHLEQQPGSGQVALDASSYLTGGARTPGSCPATSVLFDAAGAATGGCCSKPDGSAGRLVPASWSSTLFLCR